MSFQHIQVGDTVTRMLAGVIPMQLTVTEVTVDRIRCGLGGVDDAWEFDRDTGAEVDDELQWGPAYGITGSFLVATTPDHA